MNRMVRVNELLKRELGSVIERLLAGDLDCLLTVTGVQTSPDLRQARVHVSVYGGAAVDKEAAMAKLRRRRGDIQHEVARHVKLKYTPVLHFELDENLEAADRVLQLLDRLEAEDDRPRDDAPPDDVQSPPKDCATDDRP